MRNYIRLSDRKSHLCSVCCFFDIDIFVVIETAKTLFAHVRWSTRFVNWIMSGRMKYLFVCSIDYTDWTISHWKSFYHCNCFRHSCIWSTKNLRRTSLSYWSTVTSGCVDWTTGKNRSYYPCRTSLLSGTCFFAITKYCSAWFRLLLHPLRYVLYDHTRRFMHGISTFVWTVYRCWRSETSTSK